MISRYVLNAHSNVLVTDRSIPRADGLIDTLYVFPLFLKNNTSVSVEVCSREFTQIPVPVTFIVGVCASHIKIVIFCQVPPLLHMSVLLVRLTCAFSAAALPPRPVPALRA